MDMAAAEMQEDDDFMVEPRERCNTWPMQHHQAEEYMMPSPPQNPNPLPSIQHVVAGRPHPYYPQEPYHHGHHGASFHDDQLLPASGNPTQDRLENGCTVPPKRKRNRRKPADALAQKKPNPWGEESYSDLIAKALEVAPEGRMKLNEIYAWFSDNIPYFRERSSQEEAAGWKNSIRHNLSLHNRFMRIQNEGAGKSSWWVINPDAKPGRNPRRPRAATLDNTSKASMERKKRGAKKRIDMPGNIRGPGLQGNSLVGSQASILSHDPYDDEPMSSFNEFRPRTQSTISIPATGSRVSPNMEQSFEDFDFPPWVDTAAQAAVAQAAVNAPHVNELLDRTGQIRLADTGVTDNSFPRMINGQQLNGIKTSPTQMPVVKQEPVTNGGIKTEINGVHPPPSYHELNSVRANSQLQQNPLLRTQLHSALGLAGTKLTAPPGVGVGFPCFTTPMYSAAGLVGCPTTMLPTVWPPSSSTATIMTQNISCGQSAGLPTDLENLNLPDHSLMDLDMESLLRHELELSQNEKLGFD
ncbi:hypothetical protein L596_010238 [Steinernema carpocapsae]|uniref:Forkhead box protein O n=1 Tax=Steinernema carpocapsae TaxID=34508 RepID=A0A4U5PIH2_STECR|nr:hypothetical protein L596_010238 [Steinernema carpocapsae]